MNRGFLVAQAMMILLTAPATAQGVVFDFDTAPLHASLPLSLTVGAITADFSSTGQGYSIQRADTMGFTPVGFAGNCIYPNSVFASDLLVGFSRVLTGFSILYAPQELGCDSSATLRITAYRDGVLVGTAVTNASAPGTWPSETLAFVSPSGFNRVVIHYDTRPACADWGPIFMADNMTVVPAPPEIILTNPGGWVDGSFRFTFSNTPGASCSVLATADPATPFSTWNLLGTATETASGQFQFIDPQATNNSQRFYRVRSP